MFKWNIRKFIFKAYTRDQDPNSLKKAGTFGFNQDTLKKIPDYLVNN